MLDLFASSLLINLSQVFSPWMQPKFEPSHIKSSYYFLLLFVQVFLVCFTTIFFLQVSSYCQVSQMSIPRVTIVSQCRFVTTNLQIYYIIKILGFTPTIHIATKPGLPEPQPMFASLKQVRSTYQSHANRQKIVNKLKILLCPQ